MQRNYKIKHRIGVANPIFIYVINWDGLNQIDLVGCTKNEHEFHKNISYTVGVWKIKY